MCFICVYFFYVSAYVCLLEVFQYTPHLHLHIVAILFTLVEGVEQIQRLSAVSKALPFLVNSTTNSEHVFLKFYFKKR